jgi:GT2 family glycosyltransferase
VIDLSIVFLNFNRLAETRRNVELLREMVGSRRNVEIIAVDNGSEDGTRAYLQQQKDIKAVLLDYNGGIAGYNEGFERAEGACILVLDDDSCPRDAAVIDKVLRIFRTRPDVGLVACRIENSDGSPQWSWHLPEEEGAGPSPFFVGCGFAVRKRLFHKAGWYPGRFFLYQNEIEVTFKIRQQGYLVWYCPDCRVVHRGDPGSRPGRRRIFYPTRNTIWIIRKFYPQPLAGLMIFSRLVIGLGRALYFRELAAYGQAVVEAFREPVRKRILSADIRRDTRAFQRQNSIVYHIIGKK